MQDTGLQFKYCAG